MEYRGVIMNYNKLREVVSENPILIFQHLAKTGGTTYASIMQRCIRQNEFFNSCPHNFDRKGHHGIWDIGEIEKMWARLPAGQKARIRWSGGHIPAQTREIFDRPAYYFGFVRNPVDMVISSLFYNFQRFNKSLDTIDEMNAIFARLKKQNKFSNPQTRHISGAEVDEIITLEHLEKAKRQVDENFVFLAPTERFDDALVISHMLFDWPIRKLFYVRQNVTQTFDVRDYITAEQRQRLKELHALDVKLYDHACMRFDELMCSLGTGFRAKAKLFHFVNEKMPFVPRRLSLAGPSV